MPGTSVVHWVSGPRNRPATKVIMLLTALLLAGCHVSVKPPAPQSVRALWAAHSHNDYEQPRPLQDALDHGFASVEADIYLVNGELLVGHTPFGLTSARTLDALYLKPLQKRVRDGHGSIYPGQAGARPFILLIDIKSEAEPTYRVLYDRLSAYAEMLSCTDQGVWKAGAIMVVVSGNRPIDAIRHQSGRGLVGIDGRPADLNNDAPAHFIPMISTSWSSLFHWNGEGPMPPAELIRLRDFVRRAHAQGRMVRFWAAPERESAWRLLLDERVDMISTDHLSELQEFLSRTGPVGHTRQ